MELNKKKTKILIDIPLILNFLTGVILIALAIDYYKRDLRTFWIIFMLLGLDRYDAANLYWKMKNGK